MVPIWLVFCLPSIPLLSAWPDTISQMCLDGWILQCQLSSWCHDVFSLYQCLLCSKLLPIPQHWGLFWECGVAGSLSVWEGVAQGLGEVANKRSLGVFSKPSPVWETLHGWVKRWFSSLEFWMSVHVGKVFFPQFCSFSIISQVGGICGTGRVRIVLLNTSCRAENSELLFCLGGVHRTGSNICAGKFLARFTLPGSLAPAAV